VKQIEELRQRVQVVTEEIRRTAAKPAVTFGDLSNEQQNRLRALKTDLYIIEWELLGAMSARLIASSPKNQPD